MRVERGEWFLRASSDSSDGNAKEEGTRRKIFQNAGFPSVPLITCKQVHGDRIAVVEDASVPLYEGVDGLITDRKDLAIGVYSADCAPVFLTDPDHRVLGMIHSGWRGAAQKIVGKGIALMVQRWNSDPSRIQISTGTHIRDCCYEVGAEVASQFSKAAIRSENGKTYFSLDAAIAEQAEEAGVPRGNIRKAESCTVSDAGFYSWRRDKTEDRMISLAVRTV